MLLLPAGPPVPNPAALLSSARMRQLLTQLRAHCDYVVIDTPSAARRRRHHDAPLADGVIRDWRTSAARTEQHTGTCCGQWANVIARPNDAPTERVDSYRFHTHYYGHTPALPVPGNGNGQSKVTVITAEEEAHAPRPPIPQVRRRSHSGLIVMAIAVLCAAVGTSYRWHAAPPPHRCGAGGSRPPAVTVTAVVAEADGGAVERTANCSTIAKHRRAADLAGDEEITVRAPEGST
jgi:hypothetical protein